MPAIAIFMLISSFVSATANYLTNPKEFERIAAVVNSRWVGWTADPSASGRFTSLSHVKMLCGTFQRGHPQWLNVSLPEYTDEAVTTVAVPVAFDPRTAWPNCTVIGKVRNQAGCGSCWAFGATESFEGSRCIATGEDIEFSADDTAACSDAGNGCSGGQPSAANSWFVSNGVVTGGEYGTADGCLPYVCPPCAHGLYPPDCPEGQCTERLQCTRECSNPAYPKRYSTDKVRAQSAFSVWSVAQMQQALMTTGPLSVSFSVYADFPTYSNGVYRHTTGGMLGGHAVVMLGWGSEGGRDFWNIKNSWTDKWGDKGYFKIARGTDECGIESDVSGTRHATVSPSLPSPPNRVVKVLSFVGQGAGIADVDNQHMCFDKDIIPGITIRGTKSETISSETLKGYDVVLMPGGSSFYTDQSDVDVEAIRAFVKAGGGYYGTCAGAYGGCASISSDPVSGVINPYTGRKVVAVRNDTNGNPVYPREAGMGVSRANCHMFYQVGKTQNKMTMAGAKLFGLSGDVPIDHHNGPAMDGGGTAAAVFDDTSMKGMNSIVLDTYGSGRSILISPHPEHDYLQNCGIVTHAAAYAAGLSSFWPTSPYLSNIVV